MALGLGALGVCPRTKILFTEGSCDSWTYREIGHRQAGFETRFLPEAQKSYLAQISLHGASMKLTMNSVHPYE